MLLWPGCITADLIKTRAAGYATAQDNHIIYCTIEKKKGPCGLKNEDHSLQGAGAFRQKTFCSNASAAAVLLVIQLDSDKNFGVLTVSHCSSVLVATQLKNPFFGFVFGLVFVKRLQSTNS